MLKDRTLKNILCIRPDNMGDLLMSTPAIRALKETFRCRITVLISPAAQNIAESIPEIDVPIIWDMPWVKTSSGTTATEAVTALAAHLKKYQFDAAVIFTVYSQNPMPSIMVAWLADIPVRLAYCRENPYALLTHWIPDPEPYTMIRHQVRRDLDLVTSLGAYTAEEGLSLRFSDQLWPHLACKLTNAGIDIQAPWVILHAGVSEQKRSYPSSHWISTAGRIIRELGYQVLFTGIAAEKKLTDELAAGTGSKAFSIAGLLSLNEFMLLIKKAPLVVSVNTGTIHIAAAAGTPVIVLYALTNPQHSPWKTTGKVLCYDVSAELRSKNEVIRYVREELHPTAGEVLPEDIIRAAEEILSGNAMPIPEMIPLNNKMQQVFQLSGNQ
jgi:ADP-heptose:LPS heptosyltransferase